MPRPVVDTRRHPDLTPCLKNQTRLPGSESRVRCCHCERPLGRLAAKCPTCLTRQFWWKAAGTATLLLSVLWLLAFGIPMFAG